VSVCLSVCLCVVKRFSDRHSYNFSLILTKLGTHNLCGNTQKTMDCGTDFRKLDLEIFLAIFSQFSILYLVSGTTVAVLKFLATN